MIISKDQKVSEFRQEWINRLRDDIAEYLGHIETISAIWQSFSLRKDEPRINGAELKDFTERIQDDIRAGRKAHCRIVLRLNPTEHKELIDKLDEIDSLLSNPDNLQNAGHINNLFAETTKLSHIFLRKEWKRVKRGEPSFILTKYTALIVFIVVLAFSAYFGMNYFNNDCKSKNDHFSQSIKAG